MGIMARFCVVSAYHRAPPPLPALPVRITLRKGMVSWWSQTITHASLARSATGRRGRRGRVHKDIIVMVSTMFRRTRSEGVPAARPGRGGQGRGSEKGEGEEVGGDHLGCGRGG
jgi:hypothetical protein